LGLKPSTKVDRSAMIFSSPEMCHEPLPDSTRPSGAEHEILSRSATVEATSK